MRDLPNLLPLVAFESAARHLSFKLAAEELCITPSAVSHRIRGLEDQLGVALFHRFNRELALTDVGTTYFRAVQEALRSIARSTKTVTTPGAVETLVLQSPPSLASKWLMPRLSTYLSRNPRLRLRLNATEDRVNFQRRPVDLAICHHAPTEEGIHSEVLLRENFLPLCAPTSWFESPDDLSRAPLIEAERNPVGWATWLETHNVLGVDLQQAFRIDPSAMAIQAAVEGIGVVLESDLLAGPEIHAGKLICPFRSDSIQRMERNYYLVFLRSRESEPKIGEFAQWLRTLSPNSAP